MHELVKTNNPIPAGGDSLECACLDKTPSEETKDILRKLTQKIMGITSRSVDIGYTRCHISRSIKKVASLENEMLQLNGPF
ncbi:hypothetical protein B6U96_18340 [Archaeoglobales archaeon ex4484_92]|nr:MAG: hypothetical protein B6U96_18340 [Archaeoglobales archaeon ex4484_92]